MTGDGEIENGRRQRVILDPRGRAFSPYCSVLISDQAEAHCAISVASTRLVIWTPSCRDC